MKYKVKKIGDETTNCRWEEYLLELVYEKKYNFCVLSKTKFEQLINRGLQEHDNSLIEYTS